MTLGGSNSDQIAVDQLQAFVERIERMHEEKKAISDDIGEIYAEAKGNGFDKTVLGQVVSYVEKRKKDPDTLAERSALFELYISALDGSARGGDEDDDDAGTEIARTRMTQSNQPAEYDAPKPMTPGGPNGGEGGDTLSADQSKPTVDAGEAHAPHHSDEAAGSPPAGAGLDTDRQPIQTGGDTLDHGGEDLAAVESLPAIPSKKARRPYCLRPEMCGGYGANHCHSCLLAHADVEGLSA